MGKIKVKGVYGKSWAESKKIPVTKKVLEKLAKCLLDSVIHEGKKDFAKRGWSLDDPMGGAPFHESWGYKITGESTIEFTSSFYGIRELTGKRGIPKRKMTWLTQEHKNQHPERFNLTPKEKELGMKKMGRPKKGERLPLIIPIQEKSGNVIFRYAPFKTSDSWIHPGIARFNFMERGIRKGKKNCIKILRKEIVKFLSEGDPTQ